MDDNIYNAEAFQTLVIDNGSTTIRAGFAGDEAPRSVFPAIVGRPKVTEEPSLGVNQSAYVGDAIGGSMRDTLNLNNPIQRGIITNWDDMEKIWHHVFYSELGVTPESHPVLLTEVPLNPRANREKMTQIVFETFNVPCLYIIPSGVLALYACGRGTGVVLSSGGGITNAIPIFEGYALSHGITQLDIGGKDVTDQLIKLIYENHGTSFNTRLEREEINFIKTKCTYIASDYENEVNNPPNGIEYDIFEGHITLRTERFLSPEIMFRPSLFGLETDGVHELINNSVMKSDVDIRNMLYHSIVLEGGNTMFPGFAERLQHELMAIIPAQYYAKILAPYDRLYSAWIGGSILGSLSTFLRMCISKQDYDEIGPRVVHRTCI